MKAPIPWYEVANAGELVSPALLVYPARIRRNILEITRLVGDVSRLWSHVKTHKTKELVLLQLKAGIRKFKCATLAEAEMLAECTVPEVLLAYPIYGASLSGFVTLAKGYVGTRFSAIVDNLKAAEELSDAALSLGLVINAYVDLDVGMGRTGIVLGDGAKTLYCGCMELQGLEVSGLHIYDGHIRDRDAQQRARMCRHLFNEVLGFASELQALGYPSPRIIAGGSPTLPFYADCTSVECSSGTFILWDKGYADTLPEQSFQPAAVLLARVVCVLGERRLCVDVGYKAVASENDIANRVHFLNAPDLIAVAQSEEHLVLESSAAHTWKVGDVLYGLPVHVCPTVALFDRLMVVTEGCVTGHWEVRARNRWQSLIENEVIDQSFK